MPSDSPFAPCGHLWIPAVTPAMKRETEFSDVQTQIRDEKEETVGHTKIALLAGAKRETPGPNAAHLGQMRST